MKLLRLKCGGSGGVYAACAVIILVVICIVNLNWMQSSASFETLPYTAIVVLGGGVTSSAKENDWVPQHTQLRVEKAVELFHHLQKAGEHVIIITTSNGTPYKPNPITEDGFPMTEAVASALKLVKMGIPADSVFEENLSLDTIGNAYFVRSIHIDQGEFRKVVLITNNWHMPRAQAIFQFVFGLPPNTMGHMKSRHYRAPQLEFVEAEAGIKDLEILNIRTEKEQKSLLSFQKSFLHSSNSSSKNEINSFSDLRIWLFSQHSAYSTSRHLPHKREVISSELLKTY